MSLESGPSFDPQAETALGEKARLELLAELSANRQEQAHRAASAEVGKYPRLAAILGRLIEGGPEMSSEAKAHLRKMMALSFKFPHLIEDAEAASLDEEFYLLAAGAVDSELDELFVMAEGDPLPDLWDIAYQDLCAYGKDGEEE